MSWIAGLVFKANAGEGEAKQSKAKQSKAKLLSILAKPELVIDSTNLQLLVGGISETLHHSTSITNPEPPRPDTGWVVVGSGITHDDKRSRFLGPREWDTFLSASSAADSARLDGHFLVCRWNRGEVEFFNDQLGQRTLFLAETDQAFWFSTRLDWLCRLAGRTELDFGQLGSKWLYINQMIPASGVVGVTQLGPGGRCTIGARGMKTGWSPWSPQSFNGSHESQYVDRLEQLSNPELPPGRRLFLGMSGGLDSRTLLSVLLTAENPLELYVFGEPGEPDVILADRISKRLGTKLTHFNDPLPSSNETLVLVKEYVSCSNLTEPGLAALRQRYFARIQARNGLMLDGGFGELSRRQYLNRMLLRGKDALVRGDVDGITDFLRAHRGSFFNADVVAEMERGAVAQVRRALSEMPRLGDIGIGNYVDLFTLRTRVPFWGCHEQARLDGLVQNYMPFAQPSLLNAMFGLDVSFRSSGRLFRRIIRGRNPGLTAFPLVKSNSTYPFSLGPAGAWLWTNAKSKFSKGYSSRGRHEALHLLKEFALDTLNSAEMGSDGVLNMLRLGRIVQGFFDGQEEHLAEVEWWLTFQLWRSGLKY